MPRSPLQFAPIDGLTFTGDYTYARERAHAKIAASRPSGCSATASTTSSSTPATKWPRPCILHEFTGASKDFGYEQQHREQNNELNSVGFNADWDVTDSFNLGFDYHDSRAAQPAE